MQMVFWCSEEGIARGITGDSLKGEIAQYSFSVASGGEELRGAPLIFVPNLIQMVLHLLEENHRYL